MTSGLVVVVVVVVAGDRNAPIRLPALIQLPMQRARTGANAAPYRQIAPR